MITSILAFNVEMLLRVELATLYPPLGHFVVELWNTEKDNVLNLITCICLFCNVNIVYNTFGVTYFQQVYNSCDF